MIGIIDSGSGNIASVENALTRIGQTYLVSDDVKELEKANKIIFPGVGNAGSAMKKLQSRGLDCWVRETKKPFLGICLGMQLLFESSEEGNIRGLGIFQGNVRRFPDRKKYKIPQMGWNTLEIREDSLFQNLETSPFVYFVHSYYGPVTSQTIGKTDYSLTFSSVVKKDNFYGIQFHPEKSGRVGEQILRNFCNL